MRAFGSANRLPSCAGPEQDRGHRCRLADADGGHRRPHVLHRVVDGETSGDHAAGGVDVELDVLVGILALQEQELGHDDVGHIVVDLCSEEHDAVFQQTAEDVPAALAAMGGLDHLRIRDEIPRAFEQLECLGPVLGSSRHGRFSFQASVIFAFASMMSRILSSRIMPIRISRFF